MYCNFSTSNPNEQIESLLYGRDYIIIVNKYEREELRAFYCIMWVKLSWAANKTWLEFDVVVSSICVPSRCDRWVRLRHRAAQSSSVPRRPSPSSGTCLRTLPRSSSGLSCRNRATIVDSRSHVVCFKAASFIRLSGNVLSQCMDGYC